MSTYIQWHHKYSSLKVLIGHKTLAQSSSRTKLIHSEAVCIPGICADSGSLVVEAVLVEPTMKGAASSSWHEQKRWWNSPSLSAAELNNWKKFRRQIYHNSFFLKIAPPGLFFVYFLSFEINKQTVQFLQQINVKKCRSSIIWCWDSNPRPIEHESSRITTRPGLPPNLPQFFVPLALTDDIYLDFASCKDVFGTV